jgi:hypothetical protein
VHSPVRVDDHYPSAGSGDPYQLADGDVRRVDVLEDAFTVDTVEGGVGDRQSGDVTEPEVDWERWVDRASAGFTQHGVARFDSDDDAGRADEVGEGAGRVTGAAADVDDVVAVAGVSSEVAAARRRWRAGIAACSSRAAIGVTVSSLLSMALKLPSMSDVTGGGRG